jgi:SAM-dependent methyltransferase
MAPTDSLAVLMDLIAPRPEWTALDVATGGSGITAATFAPHIHRMIVNDLSAGTLAGVRESFAGQGIANASFVAGDSARLPFAEGSFDLTICRRGLHHFPNMRSYVSEAARVTKPGGLIAISEQIAPPGARDFFNAVEALYHKGHTDTMTAEEWEILFYEAGLVNIRSGSVRYTRDLAPWVERMEIVGDDLLRLRAIMAQAPEAARETMNPIVTEARLAFDVTEWVLIGEKRR